MTLRMIAVLGVLLFALGCGPADSGTSGSGASDDGSNTTAAPVGDDVQLVSATTLHVG